MGFYVYYEKVGRRQGEKESYKVVGNGDADTEFGRFVGRGEFFRGLCFTEIG